MAILSLSTWPNRVGRLHQSFHSAVAMRRGSYAPPPLTLTTGVPTLLMSIGPLTFPCNPSSPNHPIDLGSGEKTPSSTTIFARLHSLAEEAPSRPPVPTISGPPLPSSSKSYRISLTAQPMAFPSTCFHSSYRFNLSTTPLRQQAPSQLLSMMDGANIFHTHYQYTPPVGGEGVKRTGSPYDHWAEYRKFEERENPDAKNSL